ncbi:hypothetical protein ACFXTN_014269 [Malus domestica]
MCRTVIGLLVRGKLFWVLDDVASSLEVLFLHPGMVSLTDEDAQGLFLNWAGGFSSFLQGIRPTQEFEGQNKSIKSRHKMLKMSTREQCQVRTRRKEKIGKKHDMGYPCF